MTGAVVNVGAGLAARSGVTVENNVQAFLLAPGDGAIKQGKTALQPNFRMILGREQLIIERHANGVHSKLLDITNIVARDVVVVILLPKCQRCRWPDEFFNHLLNLPMRRRHLQLEHVAFRQEPISKIDTTQLDRLAIRRDDLLALRADKFDALKLCAFPTATVAKAQNGAQA